MTFPHNPQAKRAETLAGVELKVNRNKHAHLVYTVIGLCK